MTYWKQQRSARCATNRNYKYIRLWVILRWVHCKHTNYTNDSNNYFAIFDPKFLTQEGNLITWQLPIHNLVCAFQSSGPRSKWFKCLDPRRSLRIKLLQLYDVDFVLIFTDWTWLTLLNPQFFFNHSESNILMPISFSHASPGLIFYVEMVKRSLSCVQTKLYREEWTKWVT